MSKLTRRGMNYTKAYKGSGRGISASQYNGLLDMHRDLYAANPNQLPVPPALQNSVIANAVTADNVTADIPAYTPVKLLRQLSIIDPDLNAPAYVVGELHTPSGAENTDYTTSYGFTLSEGISREEGGRVVIAGIAFVAVSRDDMTADSKAGTFDSMFYVVNDDSITPYQEHKALAPMGHFKAIAWYNPVQVNAEISEPADEVLVMIDMAIGSDPFIVTTADVCDRPVESAPASGIFETKSVEGFVMYVEDNYNAIDHATDSTRQLDLHNNTDKYEVRVWNVLGCERSPGDHLVEYSAVYGCLIFSGLGQTVKIGKADAAITFDSTGTVSIWRDGADTTENITGVELDWMHGDANVSLGKEVVITYFADEDVWRITGAECE